MLPTITVDGLPFFLDARLHELRACDNPHVRVSLTNDEVDTLTEAVADGVVEVHTEGGL
jgi:hypothetical protein